MELNIKRTILTIIFIVLFLKVIFEFDLLINTIVKLVKNQNNTAEEGNRIGKSINEWVMLLISARKLPRNK